MLQQYGLPKFKLDVRAQKGRKWLLTLLAVGYAATAVHQVVWGSACLFVGPFTLGALRCFIVAACAHVCRGAISVGVLLVCLQSQIVSSQSVDRPF
ncbi:unnamed protein product [Durusdinium trenchii]|uniref:Uncharacterized protein n=1 Tax=Durusdinium trenchii TaxID=1381693 RepID=A0ABP0SZI9_9DINO